MEDDKKKKKNKKKKSKQVTRQKESAALDARETTSSDQGHASGIGQDNNCQVPVTLDAPNDVGGKTTADRNGHLANGTEGTSLTKDAEQYHLDREASFQEKIKELQAEKNAQIQKEAIRVEKIQQLLKEKDEYLQKEASQKDKIKELHDEKNASMQNEASIKEKFVQLEKEKDALIHKRDSLEQIIIELQSERDSHQQKEATLEMKILQLEGEKGSWAQRESEVEEKINQLVDEAATLNLKTVSLQEKLEHMERERDSWILAENTAKESIAGLSNDNIKLRAQVMELEHSRKSLLKEKQQLTETISRLQLQVNSLEGTAMNNEKASEDRDVNIQIEAARQLVEKLVLENSELVEKVNELYAELDKRSLRSEHVSYVGEAVTAQSTHTAALKPDMEAGNADIHGFSQANNSTSEASKVTMPVSVYSRSLEDVVVEDQRNNEHLIDNAGSGVSNSSEIIEIDEIVQIPLDENEHPETKAEVAQDNDSSDVPLADAPLIGAPFRLISFVARYVSGADLMNTNMAKPG